MDGSCADDLFDAEMDESDDETKKQEDENETNGEKNNNAGATVRCKKFTDSKHDINFSVLYRTLKLQTNSRNRSAKLQRNRNGSDVAL